MIRQISSGVAAAVTSLNFPTNRSEPIVPSEFALEDFFSGQVVAEARFVAINGVKRHFRIKVTGVFENDNLRLHEEFEFDDGETDTKTWHFRKISDGRYMASREDLHRPVEAIIRNETLRYSYVLYMDPHQRKNAVRFWDKITRIDHRTLKNTAVVFKFGIPVGLVTGTFRKQI